MICLFYFGALIVEKTKKNHVSSLLLHRICRKLKKLITGKGFSKLGIIARLGALHYILIIIFID